MKLIKFLFLIGVILTVWYLWQHYSEIPQSDVEVADTGFMQVAWIQDASPNEVIVMGPTWNSPTGRRTRQLVWDLEAQDIPCRFVTSVQNIQQGDQELTQAWNTVMQGMPPIVYINGKAKANPTLEDVVTEYHNSWYEE